MLSAASTIPGSLRRAVSSSSARGSAAIEYLLVKKPDDIVVTLAVRSAMTRAKKGAFKDTPADSLLHGILNAVQNRSGIDPALVEDIALGKLPNLCWQDPALTLIHLTGVSPSPVYEARAASLAAGFPEHVPVQAINRLCASGLMAVRSVSDSIARGDIEIGLAVGYESMSTK
jgi:acetyl-CoA acyltransferase 1